MARQKPIIASELILWKHVDRNSSKGYIARDFFKGTTRYQFLSAAVTSEGIRVFGMRDREVKSNA